MVLGLLIISCDQANNVSKKIENCSDDIIKKDFNKELSDYELNNSYFSKKRSINKNIKRQKLIVQILENELKYLLSIENEFLDLKKKYTSLFGSKSNLWHIRPLFMTYSDVNQLSKSGETELLNKRKRSRFFDNYEKTKNYLEKNIRTHKSFVVTSTDKLNKFEVEGERKINESLEAELELKKKGHKKFLKKKLEDKLQNSSYEKYYILCEKRRSESPIMFDEKWK